MLKKSIYSYHVVIDDVLYLYNSIKGSSSLAKIYNPDIVKKIEDMIKCENLNNGDSKVIKLLNDINFINDKSIEEEKKERDVKRLQIENTTDLLLTIIPTTNCNFKCAYCYEEYRPQKMNAITQNNLIDFVKEKMKGCRNLYVSWFGGEPLLALDVIKSLSNEFIKITNNLKKSYIASMTTNGYLLTPEVVKELMKFKIIHYQVTLDGIKTTHDSLRIHKNQLDTYNVIFGNLMSIKKHIKSSILKITIRTNYTKPIYQNIQKYYDIMKELECKIFNFSIKIASNWGGNKIINISDQLLEISDYPRIINFFNDTNPKPDFSGHLDFFDSQTSICGAAKKNSYIVNSDGAIYKCTVDFDNKFGSIYDNNTTFDNIYYKDSSIDNECDNCFFSGSCLNSVCPKAKKDKIKACPPEKIYINDFLQLLPEKCFSVIY